MKSVLFYALIASQLVYFHTHYQLRDDGTALLAFAHNIRDHTKPNDVILIYGAEWNPVIAYYAERKAVMFPASLMTPKQIADATEWAKTLQVGAVVRCAPGCEVRFR